jgi:hypothetical protein
MPRDNTLSAAARRMFIRCLCVGFTMVGVPVGGVTEFTSLSPAAFAETPGTAYMFPAGAQRGSRVKVRIGGYYLHEKSNFELLGPGVTAPTEVFRVPTVWFEGPLVKLPASQRSEDYPRDYEAEFTIAADAPLGPRLWRAWNGQGGTPARRFVVGDLPEVVEQEIDGEPIPTAVKLPVTINGRIFPREDVDVWTFEPTPGRVTTCAVEAAALGSPLEARIEVRDPDGTTIADATSQPGADPLIQFTARRAGPHELHIHDVRGEGLQSYVYRVTVTDGPWTNPMAQLLDPPAAAAGLQVVREVEPNDAEPNDAEPRPFTGPAMLYGRIDDLADRDSWSVALTKGVEWTVETHAARLGSQLLGVLVVTDASGREVARAVSDANSPDPLVRFTPAADGVFTISLSDRFAPPAVQAIVPLAGQAAVPPVASATVPVPIQADAQRGAPRPYRLRVAPTQPGFQLEVANDLLNVERGATGKLVVQVNREGGFKEPVTLSVDGVPAGVEIAELVVAPNQNRGELLVKPAATAAIGPSRVRVVGRATVNGQAVAVPARILAQGLPGHTPNPPPPTAGTLRGVDASPDHVWLCVALPTPFKFQGVYEMTYIPCGAVSRKNYVVQRNGYEGPLQVELADRQARHLQGVTGPTITVPAGVSEFTYPIALPPWMELGRTSRVVLMATGEVDDGMGRRHKVTFTSGEQNNQMVNLVSPSPLRIVIDRGTAAATAGKTTSVKVRIRRDRSLPAPVRLELVQPPHLRDVTAAPVTVPADQESGELTMAFGDAPGPFTAPLVIRATADRAGDPLVAEASVELVPVP